MTFRIQALTLAPFQPLFDLVDDALFARGARRMVADAPNSAPCRVSLRDADVGDRLILLNHRHLDDPTSPYRATGPIFVREARLKPRLTSASYPPCCPVGCFRSAPTTPPG